MLGRFGIVSYSRRHGRILGTSYILHVKKGAAERPELFGHGKGEHAVFTRQTAAKLGREPLPGLVVPALRAVPVAAGAADKVPPLASRPRTDRRPHRKRLSGNG